MKNTIVPLISGVCAGLLVALLFLALDYSEKQRYQEVLHTQTINQLSQVRAKLEADVNANFYLTRGLIAIVATQPDLQQETFQRIAQYLLRHHSFIINMALAPDNIVRFVFPVEKNAKAVGLNYAENESQWPAVDRAIKSKKTVVAGPVNLVQGGAAFISRTPIYIDSDDPGMNDRYWGLASIVIDKDELFKDVGFYRNDKGMRLAIRGADGLGSNGAFIDGDRAVFQHNPVLLEVHLPEGSWQLAAVPNGGWDQASPYLLWIRVGGAFLALCTGIGIFSWINKLLQTQRKIEAAHSKAIFATNALQESENFLNAIIENIPNMVFVKEAKTLKFVRFNKAGEQLLGALREDLLGKNDHDLFPQEQADFFTKCDRDVLANKKLVDIPAETIATVHHGQRILHTKKIPIVDADDVPQYLLGISEDITERLTAEAKIRKLNDELEKRVLERTAQLDEANSSLIAANERLAELDKLKSMFIASMSHELRTPLNAIIGFSSLVLNGMTGEINAQQRDQLERVYRSGKHLLALITDVIDISKIESGRVHPYPSDFALLAVIDEACDSLKLQIGEKNLQLIKTIPDDSLMLHSDRKRLLQCLLNYLSNAVKFTKQGQIELSVQSDQETVTICVADTGIGIPEKDLGSLFHSFVRLDSPLKVIIPGTGLGLYLTKKLAVEVLGGEVWAESIANVGSRFYLKIPQRING